MEMAKQAKQGGRPIPPIKASAPVRLTSFGWDMNLIYSRDGLRPAVAFVFEAKPKEEGQQ